MGGGKKRLGRCAFSSLSHLSHSHPLRPLLIPSPISGPLPTFGGHLPAKRRKGEELSIVESGRERDSTFRQVVRGREGQYRGEKERGKGRKKSAIEEANLPLRTLTFRKGVKEGKGTRNTREPTKGIPKHTHTSNTTQLLILRLKIDSWTYFRHIG